MAVNPMLVSGANGMRQSMDAFKDVAQEVAEFNLQSNPDEGGSASSSSSQTSLQDTAEAMVDLKLYQRQVQASAKVVQTADEVIGFLLDVRV